jgi:hypothetical protein
MFERSHDKEADNSSKSSALSRQNGGPSSKSRARRPDGTSEIESGHPSLCLSHLLTRVGCQQPVRRLTGNTALQLPGGLLVQCKSFIQNCFTQHCLQMQ